MSRVLSYAHGACETPADRAHDRREPAAHGGAASGPRRARRPPPGRSPDLRRARRARRPRRARPAGGGLGRGDRVGIWAPNCAEWVLVQYATARTGAILVNVNPAYRTHELGLRAAPVGLPSCSSAPTRSRRATTRAMVDEVRGDCPDLRRVVVLGSRRLGGAPGRRRPAARRRVGRARGRAGLRRPDQHPVHERHDRLARRARRSPTTTSSTTASSSASCAATPSRDRICDPGALLPLLRHGHGQPRRDLARRLHGRPRAGLRARARRSRRRRGALHGALRRADDVHRRARPTRPSPSST